MAEKKKKKEGKTVRHSPAVLPFFPFSLVSVFLCLTVTWKTGKFIYITLHHSQRPRQKNTQKK